MANTNPTNERWAEASRKAHEAAADAARDLANAHEWGDEAPEELRSRLETVWTLSSRAARIDERWIAAGRAGRI